MSGRPPTKSNNTGLPKGGKAAQRTGVSTSNSANKSPTGPKSNAPNSHQKVASQLSFGIDIIDNILNRGGGQSTNPSTSTTVNPPTVVPLTPIDQEPTNGFETTQSVDLSRFQRDDPTNYLSLTDLTTSPQLVSTMKGFYTFQQVNKKTTTQAHSQIDPNFSILDRLVQSGRRDTHSSAMPQPGEYDWLSYPLNEGGFHQYPDIDRHTPYGQLTLEMCEVANVNYLTSYRTATTLSAGLLPLSPNTPDPSLPDELVPVHYSFQKWVHAVHRKYQTRYANIFLCVLHPDPLNDPVVRGLYLGHVQSRKKNRPNGPTQA
jgi:hypothetical protein